jgi:hypothetical protein
MDNTQNLFRSESEENTNQRNNRADAWSGESMRSEHYRRDHPRTYNQFFLSSSHLSYIFLHLIYALL